MSRPSARGRTLSLQASRWVLLVISLLLIAVVVSRQTGSLPGPVLRIVDSALIGTVAALAMLSAHVSRRFFAAHLVLAVAGVFVSVVHAAAGGETLLRVAAVLNGYLLVVSAFLILRVVVRERRVTADTLFGALGFYLAMGVLFGVVYTTIARWDPAAFAPPQPVVEGATSLYYFSLATLTGVGYGDISPASNAARIAASLEAVIGVIILAALVGRIVGLQVARQASVETEQRLDAIEAALVARIEQSVAAAAEAPAQAAGRPEEPR